MHPLTTLHICCWPVVCRTICAHMQGETSARPTAEAACQRHIGRTARLSLHLKPALHGFFMRERLCALDQSGNALVRQLHAWTSCLSVCTPPALSSRPRRTSLRGQHGRVRHDYIWQQHKTALHRWGFPAAINAWDSLFDLSYRHGPASRHIPRSMDCLRLLAAPVDLVGRRLRPMPANTR